MRRVRCLSPVEHDHVAYPVGAEIAGLTDAQAEALIAAGAAEPAEAAGGAMTGADEPAAAGAGEEVAAPARRRRR